MGSATMVSVEEYLATSFRPDVDYIGGTILERNVGQKDHSKLQGEVFAWFRERRRALRLAAFPEQRIRVGPGRYRVPDVCVVELPEPDEQVFTRAPYLCVEILSPDDSFPGMQDRFDDYLAMGVENIWVLDPASRRGWRVTGQGHFEALDGVLKSADGRVAMPIAELFASE
jgi:Uma2 family endonuclease